MAGISYEAGDQPFQWLAPEADIIPMPQVANTDPQPVAKKTVAATAPLVEAIPQFTDLSSYNSYVSSWKKLGICATSSSTVLGIGSTSPDLMIIAEAPDDTEDRNGIAFSGLGHNVVCQALTAANISDTQLYKSYLSKWRPPGQRPLYKTEAAQLLPLLLEEIRLVQPKALLVLGESLARAITGDTLPRGTLTGKYLFITNQLDKTNLPFQAFQKGEILVKTLAMKKTFWFTLLAYTASLRAKGLLTRSGPAHQHGV